MRLAIIGSRRLNYVNIASYLSIKPSAIVSGGAKGIDSLAKTYAIQNDIPIKEFLPDYKTYGKQAPIIRNIEIVKNCDSLIAFWDGISRGTKFTIEYARKRGIPVEVVLIP